MKVSTRYLILSGMLVVVAVSGWSDPIVQNGSFEQDVLGSPFFGDATTVANWGHAQSAPGDGPHWAVGYADGAGTVTTAGEGNEFVTMGGGGSVQTELWFQNVSGFTVGSQYDLSFMLAGETTSNVNQIVIAKVTDGNGLSTAGAFVAPTTSANYWQTWRGFDLIFVATTDTEQISFTSTTINDVGLDNVAIALANSAAVPEPGTFGLLGTGIAALAMFRRRAK